MGYGEDLFFFKAKFCLKINMFWLGALCLNGVIWQQGGAVPCSVMVHHFSLVQALSGCNQNKSL
jgi:hypothetical protein